MKYQSTAGWPPEGMAVEATNIAPWNSTGDVVQAAIDCVLDSGDTISTTRDRRGGETLKVFKARVRKQAESWVKRHLIYNDGEDMRSLLFMSIVYR